MKRGAVRSVALATWLLCGVAASAQQHTFTIIVHPENPVTSVTKEFLAEVFLKTAARWGDGTATEAVDLVGTSSTRQSFSVAIHARSTESVQRYWQQRIFSGRAVPPLEVATDAEVVAFVRERRGGVGYIAAGTATEGVKVLDVRANPERLSYVSPVYTERARKLGIAGRVVLEIVVDSNGDVGDIRVIEGLGQGLTAEAVRAVKRWKYAPARVNGEARETTLEVTIRFTL